MKHMPVVHEQASQSITQFITVCSFFNLFCRIVSENPVPFSVMLKNKTRNLIGSLEDLQNVI